VFGYLQIEKEELLVKEFETYKAVYCGLCKQMGKDYSFLTRLTLSYDCTFYAMLLMSLHSSCGGFKKGRCTCNPLKRCNFAYSKNDDYQKAAAFSIITVYYKLIDDINDSGFFKSLFSRMIKPFFSHQRKKAKKRYPWIDEYVAEMMERQAVIEQDKSSSVDISADPTAQMLGKILAKDGNDKTESRVLYEYGYNIGRWIYLMDAADDMEKDAKSLSFNPFIQEDGSSLDNNIISLTLNQCLARAYDAYNLLDINGFKGILDNMMLRGFPKIQNKITDKTQKDSDKSFESQKGSKDE